MPTALQQLPGRPAPAVGPDVLVVGAGAAGLATAVSALRHGASVLVVERRATTSTVPRATGLSVRTMEILRTWGLATAVRAGRIRCTPSAAVARTLAEADPSTTRQSVPTARQALAVSPAFPAFCAQDHLEPLLVDEIRRLGGEVRFGNRVTALETAQEGVRATLGGTTPVTARFVVGADGPHSTVRPALGLGVERLGSLGGWIQLLFRADLEQRLGRRPPGLTFVTHPDAVGVLAPVGRGRWAYVRQVDPDPDARRPAADTIGPDEWRDLLRTATGLGDLDPQFLAVLPFVMAADVATAVRAGRGFVVGDAAHRMTPLTGSGLNTAVQDGHELGWRLGWVARGLAGDQLLESYATEREPVGRARAAESLHPDPDPDPQRRLAEDVGGRRAPHAWVRFAGRRRAMLDLFENRLTLVAGGASRRWSRAAASMGASMGASIDASVRPSTGTFPLQVLGIGRDLEDVGGTLARAYPLGPAEAVLVRPDGVVAWRGERPDELSQAVAAALGRPGAAGRLRPPTSVAATDVRPA